MLDPHFFADPDPDPESQNNADPADPDPDPKHCLKHLYQAAIDFSILNILKSRL